MASRPITSISIKARRTELSDAHDALKFINQNTNDLFGLINEVGRVHELMLVFLLFNDSSKKL